MFLFCQKWIFSVAQMSSMLSKKKSTNPPAARSPVMVEAFSTSISFCSGIHEFHSLSPFCRKIYVILLEKGYPNTMPRALKKTHTHFLTHHNHKQNTLFISSSPDSSFEDSPKRPFQKGCQWKSTSNSSNRKISDDLTWFHHQFYGILWWLVGGLEPWNFMTFHSVGNFIIPTDFHSINFQRGRAQPPTRIDIDGNIYIYR